MYSSTARITEQVITQCPSAKAVLLYGSAARGEATGKSDIDMLVLTEKPCSIELEPPYSAIAVTLDEWLEAPEDFRREVLEDALVLHAKDLRLKELVAAEPWLLIRYTAPSYEKAKRELRNHLLRLHADMLREEAAKLTRRGKRLPGRSLRGLAGYIAARHVREC